MTERNESTDADTSGTHDHARGSHGSHATSHDASTQLSAHDAIALDLLIEHGFDLDAAIAAAPAADATIERRLRAAYDQFLRFESYPVEAPDASLVDATLARIAREDAAQRDRLRFSNAPVSVGSSKRWHDFIALACAAILLLSVGVPVMSWMQGRNAESMCASNLRTLGTGVASYLQDHKSLPIAAGFGAELANLADWSKYRNHKHLDALVGGGYCAASCAACGNDTTGEGYASQIPSDAAMRTWMGGMRMPAIADRNPVIDLSRRGRVIGTFTMNSPEHGGRGQNVLFTDGSVEFVHSPILMIPGSVHLPAHQENIWLPMDRSQSEDGLDSPSEWLGVDIFLLQ
jgi:hypothetical protein